VIISLWREPGPLFEQFRIPFTQGWFLPSLIEINWLVLEKKIFRNFLCIFTLLQLFSLGEGQSPSFEQFRIPYTLNDELCQVLLKLAQWFWRRCQKCKSLRTDGRTTDNGRSKKLTWAFSSGELKIVCGG
jgi:hypothetical protein